MIAVCDQSNFVRNSWGANSLGRRALRIRDKALPRAPVVDCNFQTREGISVSQHTGLGGARSAGSGIVFPTAVRIPSDFNYHHSGISSDGINARVRTGVRSCGGINNFARSEEQLEVGHFRQVSAPDGRFSPPNPP